MLTHCYPQISHSGCPDGSGATDLS